MTHPDQLVLLRHVCEPSARVHSSLGRHLEQCQSCAEEVRRLEMVRRALSGETRGEPGPECPGDELLAALAAGEVETASRREVLMHLASCPHCRSAVASLARALADPAVAAARVAGDRSSRRRFVRLAIPAAAAAVLLIAVLGRQDEESPSPAIHPAAIPASDVAESVAGPGELGHVIGQQPMPISPRGTGARPAWLRWGAVAGSELYRVTLFQPDGRTLYQLELRDTATSLPDSIGLIPGNSYLWKVEARTDWDRWTSSELVSFSVRGEPAP